MNDLIEFCSCKDRPCPAEFACHCSASIVFLCNICVVDHLREPISHSFIPIDQARKIIGANSKFNKRNAQIQKNFLLFKDQVSAYLPKISGFISQIEDFRISILHIFNQECDQNIEFLRKIKADVLSKAELMNVSMAASDFAMVEKFDLTGLGGILASYPEVFELNIEEIKEVIGNMIIIGSQASNSLLESKPNTQDLQQKLDFYKAENEEHLKRIKHYKNSENEFTSKIQQLQENLHTFQAENESQARRLINYEKTNEDYTSTIRNLEIKTNRFKTEFEALSKKLLKYEKPEEEYG